MRRPLAPTGGPDGRLGAHQRLVGMYVARLGLRRIECRTVCRVYVRSGAARRSRMAPSCRVQAARSREGRAGTPGVLSPCQCGWGVPRDCLRRRVAHTQDAHPSCARPLECVRPQLMAVDTSESSRGRRAERQRRGSTGAALDASGVTRGVGERGEKQLGWNGAAGESGEWDVWGGWR